jgi:hypothetical protein
MAPLVQTAAEPPAEIAVAIKADGGHNPYMATGFGRIGKSWLATLTNKATKATFTVMVNAVQGVEEPPTAGQVCAALQDDVGLNMLTLPELADRFGYPKNGHGLAEAAFIKGVLARRAEGAASVGLDPKKAKPAAKQERQAPAAPAHVAPAAPVAAKRTRNKTCGAPAPPSPPSVTVASAIDF